jgi:hypothetical protein
VALDLLENVRLIAVKPASKIERRVVRTRRTIQYRGKMMMVRCMRWLTFVTLALALVYAQGCTGARNDAAQTAESPGILVTTADRDQEGVPPHMQKVSPALRAVITQLPGHVANPQVLSTHRVRVNAAGEIQAYVLLTEYRTEHVARLEALGMRVELTLPDFRVVQGWIPGDVVEAVAMLDFVRQVKPPDYPVPRG